MQFVIESKRHETLKDEKEDNEEEKRGDRTDEKRKKT